MSHWLLDAQIEIEGKTLVTDQETKALLEKLIPEAKKKGDYSAVMGVIGFGLMSGRIVKNDVVNTGER